MMAEVRVNPSFHRFLIGRNGVNLRDISERTGARIVFPSQSDHDNDCILIIGQQDSIGKAKAELELRIKDLVSSSSSGCSCFVSHSSGMHLRRIITMTNASKILIFAV